MTRHPRPALLLALLLASGCSSPTPAEPTPSSPPPPADPTPSIVLRGEPTARPSSPGAAGPDVDRALIEALERQANRPPASTPPGDATTTEATPADELGVVLGEAQGFRLRVEARRAASDAWTATIDLQERAGHAWAAVEVTLEPFAGRRALGSPTRAQLERLERRGRLAAQAQGALPPGADRLRVSVTQAEPQPGEADVAWRARRLRGFDVRAARLLRTRAHELDAILELGGGPLEHVPWSGADVAVAFLDDRGEALTRGRARLVRGQGPPWRLHVVGAAASRVQVGLIELEVERLSFD